MSAAGRAAGETVPAGSTRAPLKSPPSSPSLPVDLCGPANADDMQRITASAGRRRGLASGSDTVGRSDVDMSRPMQAFQQLLQGGFLLGAQQVRFHEALNRIEARDLAGGSMIHVNDEDAAPELDRRGRSAGRNLP